MPNAEDSKRQSHELARVDAVTRALSQAKTLEEVKDIRGKAEALRHYARTAMHSLENQNQLAEIKLRAERKAGRMLASMRLKGGKRRSKSHALTLKLEDLGITKNQSACWQREALVPEDMFLRYLVETKRAGHDVSSAGLLRLARKLGLAGRRRSGARAASRKAPVSRGCPGASGAHERASAAEELGELYRHLKAVARMLKPVLATPPAPLPPAARRYLSHLLSEVDRLASGVLSSIC